MISLEDLQEAMRARLAQEGLATAKAVAPRRDPARAALSFGQRSVWAHQQIAPDSSAYNLCLALSFEGSAQAPALRQAFEALARRHEVLRTTYHADEDGEPYQQIHDDLPPRLAEADLTGHAPEEADRLLGELARSSAKEGFDLASESSLRVTFVRTRADRLVAVVVIQHIAWDGMTLPALSRDVEDFYRQALQGEVAVRPLALQVADFAEWEQDRFHAEDQSEDAQFWASRFDGEVPELRLPYDRRPVAVSERGMRSDRPLSDQAEANLRRLSVSLRTTSFSVFLSAYYLALRQMTGQDDMVVGTTVANRDEAGMELLVGNLSNVLPLRLTGQAGSFAELVARTGAAVTEAFRHKGHPQEGIVAAVNRATGNVGSRLFETMVLFLHERIDGPQLPGTTTSWELIDNGGALLPLVVETFMHAERTDVQITYRTDLFDQATIDRLHEYIDQMLSASAPESRLEELLVLSASDRAALAEWSNGGAAQIEQDSVDSMIRSSARLHPDRAAVVFEDVELSYREFDERVNRLARLLLARGVRMGDRVGVYAERSEQLPVAFAAALRVGAVYFPVDPSYPLDRVEYMLADAGAAVLLQSARSPLGLATDLPVVDLADCAPELAALDSSPLAASELARPVHPLDGAYLLYTSGTTGRPKGVLINHRAVVNHVQWMRDFLAFDVERILQKAPLGFDVSVFELVNALCTGSTTVLPPPDWWQADVDALAGIIHRHRITQISLVPSVVRAFIDAGPDPSRLQSMRYVYLGGEAVPPALVEESSRFFGGTVLGLYGPTEAAMDLMHEDFAGAAEGDGLRSALIGRPEWNSSVHVLDEQLRQVPPGVVGELYLGGVQLAQGYHCRPGLTAAAFMACPYAAEPGARMYRTGDIARWNGRGRLEYLGRIDDQVKIRGHRVELGEIGTVLRSLPGVASATAATMAQEGSTALVAYYVPESGPEHGAVAEAEQNQRIKALLAQRLPEYMVPSALVRLEAMPLTANGKLDRRALPIPDLGKGSGRGRGILGEAETAVAHALRQTLGLPADAELAAEDDFLELGGDSISAIRMASALKKHGLVITTKALFEARTLAGIALAAEPASGKSARRLAQSEDATGWIPFNPVATMLTEQSAEHNGFSLAIAVVTPACGPEGGTLAQKAAEVLAALVERHPMLRARVAQDPEGRRGFFVPGPEEPREQPELAEAVIGPGLWEREAPGVLRAQLSRIAQTFDPSRGRVLGAALARSEDGSQGRLLLVVHHLVVDGLSWRILHDDLRQLWEGAALVDLGTSAKTWNSSVVELAASDAAAAQLPYWSAMAEGADPLLGERELDPAVDTVATVREVSTVLDADDTALLMTSATQAFGCDFLDIQVASLTVALHRFRRSRDRDARTVSLTMERHGRVESLFEGADLSNTVGWFTTVYPVTLDLGAAGSGKTMESAVKAVKEQLLAVPEQGIGWGLLRWLNRETKQLLEPHRAPQVSFNYMGRFAEPETAADAAAWGPAPEFGYLGGYADPGMPAPALLDINTVTLTSADQAILHASFRFPSGALSEAEAREIAELWLEGLGELAKSVREDPRRRLTPSDVLARNVAQQDLDRWQLLYPDCVDVYPLAPMQSGLYYTALASAGSDIYNVQSFIVLRGDLDAPRLARSLEAALNRHPNLRTAAAVSKAGQPHLVVVGHAPIPVRERSFMDLTEEEMAFSTLVEAPAVLQEFFRADQREQFDLGKAPMIRATVAHLPGRTHLLVLTMHHLLGDGWSGQLLPREIFEEYLRPGSEPLGDPLAFAKFLELTEAKAEASEAAWQRALTGVRPCLAAPHWAPSGDGRPEGRYFHIGDELARRAKAVAAEFGATFSVACQLAWANALRHVAGQQDVVFGEVVSGRPSELDGVESAVGCFANTIPSIVGLRLDWSWRANLAQMQRGRVALMEYHQYPLTSALRQVGARKLFDSMFVFQSYPPGRSELEGLLDEAGLELTGYEGGGATDNALLLMIFPASSLLPSDAVEAVLFYAEDAFEQHEIEIVEALFLSSLHAIAEQPDGLVGESSAINEEDEGLLLLRRMWQ